MTTFVKVGLWMRTAVTRKRITGTITRLGVPGPYRVNLYRRVDGTLRDAMMSEPNGAYLFPYVRDEKCFVTGHDDGAEPVNAAISDHVTPADIIEVYRLARGRVANIPDANDLTTWTLAQASVAQDQTGILGSANDATTLTDASTTGQGRALSANTADIAPGTHCWRMWIKKDPAATGYIPELQAVVDGAFLHSVQIDLASGQVTGTSQYGVRDGVECGYPDWWIVAVGYTTTGTAPLADRVFASRRATLGGDADNAAVGSAVIGWVDILTDTTPTEALEIVPYY
jgi:hypothetical protein